MSVNTSLNYSSMPRVSIQCNSLFCRRVDFLFLFVALGISVSYHYFHVTCNMCFAPSSSMLLDMPSFLVCLLPSILSVHRLALVKYAETMGVIKYKGYWECFGLQCVSLKGLYWDMICYCTTTLWKRPCQVLYSRSQHSLIITPPACSGPLRCTSLPH